MNENIALYLKPATRAAVLRMLNARGETCPIYVALQNVLEEALQAWLVKAACDDPPAAQAAARGYQWKSLFLPEGTCVRFEYKRRTWHAEVRGDHIIYEGKAYSPRQLLLHITGSVRNAWRELWIRSPGDFRWHLANTRRHILRRTPRGLHRRGVDATGPGAESAIVTAEREALIAAGKLAPLQPWQMASRACEAGLRATLYRDDLVRSDQPDLANRLGGGGVARAGRAGPRDRRWCNSAAEVFSNALAARQASLAGSA